MGLMMLVIVLLSVFYIAAEAEHECCGEDCPVCACIQQCEATLRCIGDGSAEQPDADAPVVFILFVSVFVSAAVFQDTLVSRKVRLNK